MKSKKSLFESLTSQNKRNQSQNAQFEEHGVQNEVPMVVHRNAVVDPWTMTAHVRR